MLSNRHKQKLCADAPKPRDGIFSYVLLIAAAILQAFGNPFESAFRYIHTVAH